jgi:hypothetical protein
MWLLILQIVAPGLPNFEMLYTLPTCGMGGVHTVAARIIEPLGVFFSLGETPENY